VFEMAAPIQSPAKYEARSVIQFLNAKGERPVEIHKRIVAAADFHDSGIQKLVPRLNKCLDNAGDYVKK
jgi:hypothetical protein